MSNLTSPILSTRRLVESGGGLARRMKSKVWFGLALAVWSTNSLQAQTRVNDSFAGRLTIVGSTNSVTGSNVGATAEPGEPSHAGNPAGASVWWTWVAPDSGTVIVETLGSSIDTVLAVYTGNAVNALTLVAANDDAPGLGTSLVSFPAVQGTTYQIAVDGFSGAQGDVALRLRLPVAPAAPAITSQPVGQTVPDSVGSNVTFSVGVTGSFPLALEWQKGGLTLPGGTNLSYTITNATLGDVGNYRVIITNSYGSITSSVATLGVLSRLGQDQFAGRVLITGQTNTVTAHNYGATTEPGEPVHAGVASGASVWWSWTAPQNGLVRLDTAGSTNSLGEVLDTVLGVYLGFSLSSLTPVAANNDEVPGVLRTSKVFFRAVGGATYRIAVAGARDTNGTVAVGNITLNLAQAPDNDYFANALVFSPGVTRVYDNNSGTTTEAGEPPHAGNPGGKSVWWSWVALSNGTYALDTVGSAVDTVLAVYTGTSVSGLSLVGEDDNRSDGGASLVKFIAVGGVTYRFAVDGYSGTNGVSAGDIVLNLNPSLVLNDDFAERLTLSGRTNQVSGSNLGASKQPGEPNHGGNPGGRSLWWTWTAHLTGPVLATTLTSTFDTSLAVYTGTTLTGLTLVAENDDADPAFASLVGAKLAALFPGGAGGQTNFTNGASLLVFQGVAGQTYQIAVDGYGTGDGNAAAGTVVLSLVQPTVPTPGGNDAFANRYPIAGGTNTVIGVNTNASLETGEPIHGGNVGGRSVWWSWIAPASTPVRMDTLGSSFDTVLGVYQGTSVGALTVVAADDDSLGNGRSIVVFEAVQGVEYQIAVDGFNNGSGAVSGRVVLNLHQFTPGALHANDEFENATPIASPLLSVVGNNIGATRQAGEPAHGTAQSGHSVWWTWEALVDGAVTISTVGSQFDTILAVYTGASVDSLSLVAESDDISFGHFQSQVIFQAVAGTVYRIAVDGYGVQIGFISLTVAPEASVSATPQIQQTPADQTRFAGGAGGGANVTFRVVATGSLPLYYQWVHNGTNVPGLTSDTLMVTNVTASDAGTYQVTVSNSYGAATSAGAELTVLGSGFNDDFANRIPITGTSNVLRGSILGASKEANEPNHGGNVGGRSVWWNWIAPANGAVEIHTLGSSFDTLLGVYIGSAPGSLTLIAGNDDMSSGSNYASRVAFSAVAGQEYQIAVDGFKTNNTAGNVVLTVTQPPPPPRILVQPSGLNSVHVTNSNFSLRVTTAGLTPLFQYQWLLNGNVITNAKNSSYSLGALSRASSGLYSVVITNDFGSVTSSNAAVWVQVPQQLQPPQPLPDGRVHLFFRDPDGVLSSDLARFEIHATANLMGAGTVWETNTTGLVYSNGFVRFEDATDRNRSRRFYRVIER